MTNLPPVRATSSIEPIRTPDLRYTPPDRLHVLQGRDGCPPDGGRVSDGLPPVSHVFVQAPEWHPRAQARALAGGGRQRLRRPSGPLDGHLHSRGIRRYPFVSRNCRQTRRISMVAVDEASPCFSRDHGQALFSPEGEPEPILKAQIQFCRPGSRSTGERCSLLGRWGNCGCYWFPRAVEIGAR